MDQLREWFDGSDIIAFLAGVLVPVALYLAQRRRERKALDYQRRQTETDEGRRRDEIAEAAAADVRVALRREWHTTRSGRRSFRDFLTVTNAGPAVARNVNLESFESRPSGDDPPVANREVFPIPQLTPGAGVECPVQMWGGMGSYFEAVVTWEDPRGRQRATRTGTGGS